MLLEMLGALFNVGILPTEQCIPTNGLFTTALDPVFDLIIGGLGGLFKYIVIGVLVVLGIIALVRIRSDKAAGDIKAMAMVPLVLIGAVLAIVVTVTVFDALNNVC
jgi:hypothetical protein